jgi:hypothetical protein
MNMHNKPERQHTDYGKLPRSFAHTTRELNLQGWEQGHSDLIVSRAGLASFLQGTLDAVVVDENWYLETYPDVRSAVEAGAISDAATHYRTFGYFEGRLPSLSGFNPKQYLEKNPDLQQPFDGRGEDAILEHFLRHGYQEGRDY